MGGNKWLLENKKKSLQTVLSSISIMYLCMLCLYYSFIVEASIWYFEKQGITSNRVLTITIFFLCTPLPHSLYMSVKMWYITQKPVYTIPFVAFTESEYAWLLPTMVRQQIIAVHNAVSRWKLQIWHLPIIADYRMNNYQRFSSTRSAESKHLLQDTMLRKEALIQPF